MYTDVDVHPIDMVRLHVYSLFTEWTLSSESEAHLCAVLIS
jgi:hypothetical protein